MNTYLIIAIGIVWVVACLLFFFLKDKKNTQKTSSTKESSVSNDHLSIIDMPMRVQTKHIATDIHTNEIFSDEIIPVEKNDDLDNTNIDVYVPTDAELLEQEKEVNEMEIELPTTNEITDIPAHYDLTDFTSIF